MDIQLRLLLYLRLMDKKLETATFAAGCFWHIQETFDQINGVTDTAVGFSGGEDGEPSYELVCGGDTGHAEVAQITFDPALVSYSDLLEVFWKNHDPTTLNRQGQDVGEQYRSAIFYHSEKQKELALKSKERLDASKTLSNNVVTEILPAKEFYRAEEYHQKYSEKHKG